MSSDQLMPIPNQVLQCQRRTCDLPLYDSYSFLIMEYANTLF